MLTSLAYLGIRSPHVEEWPRFATEGLGCMLADPGPDGAVRLRVDDAAWRIQVHPGEVDDIAYFGWSVEFESDLDVLAQRLVDAGRSPERGSAELCDERSVNQMVWFDDAWGFRHELVWGHSSYPGTFLPGRAHSGFVTGQQGLGHVVLMVPDPDNAHAFFTEVLGFRLSDKIIGGGLDARFYHCNGRHHSLAIGGAEGVVDVNHLMLQSRSIDDVGSGLDILQQLGYSVTRSLGRHTNDHMISFYVATPSSLHIEYGFGGLEIDETWIPQRYHAGSFWGHKPIPGVPAPGPGLTRDFASA